MSDNKITLYPSNWLYNAGVLGIIKVFEKLSYDIDSLLKKDGSFILDLDFISRNYKIKVNEFEIQKFGFYWLIESWKEISSKEEKEDEEKIKRAWGILFNVFYRGFFNANTNYFYKKPKNSKPIIEQFDDYLTSFTKNIEPKTKCHFCGRLSNATYKNKFTSEHSNLLGTSIGEKGVPNSFWNLNKESSLNVCDYCSFMLISSHLSRIKLIDKSEIFINAPSFKIMYELNKFAKESFGAQNAIEARTKREILATTIIEYANKIQTSLGIWSGMNIEIITKKNKSIEYFTLPYNVVRIISDRKIASILSDLGEYNIYNKILDEKYSELISLVQKFLRLSIKDKLNKSDKDYINNTLFLQKNRSHLKNTANKILKLYSLIEDKIKRR